MRHIAAKPALMHIEVTNDVIEAMRVAAEQEHPREACGILLGARNRITAFQHAGNVHPQPETHFEIDPQALIDAHRGARDGGLQVVGYFHSHPDGPAQPSDTDKQSASGDGRIWAIMGEGRSTLWRDKAKGFQLLSYKVTGE